LHLVHNFYSVLTQALLSPVYLKSCWYFWWTCWSSWWPRWLSVSPRFLCDDSLSSSQLRRYKSLEYPEPRRSSRDIMWNLKKTIVSASVKLINKVTHSDF